MRYDYSKVRLSKTQIDNEDYKSHFGGGAQNWDARGAFQLALLRSFGLNNDSTLLDVGCGPLRGGIHFANFLRPGNYWGLDNNPTFIEAARQLLKRQNLPVDNVSVTTDFCLEQIQRTFDYVLCFSVLNHCTTAERHLFFQQVPKVMSEHSRLIITHGKWFGPEHFTVLPVVIVRTYRFENELGPQLRFKDWGFDQPGDRLPILEFQLNKSAPTS
jgi:cyclopropane fatty-acyl-phospholipid synthase-like methyltransferase